MRRIVRFLAAVAVVAGVGLAIFVVAFVTGAGRMDDWVVRQVVKISNTYLVPEIAFEDFNYTPPLRVDLKQVTFIAPDGTEVIAVDTLRLTLAKVPKRGEPIAIQGLEIVGGRLELVQDAEGGLKGLVPFVKRSRVQNQEQVDESVRLSNVLEIRELTLRDAGFIWRSAGGAPPMEVTGLEMDLDLTPDTEQPGWYSLGASADRAPIMSLSIDGRFNIDSFVAEIGELILKTTLREDTYTTLPPPIQSFLRAHDARGEMEARLSGRLPLADWRSSDVRAALTLHDANFVLGEGRLPVSIAIIDATMKDEAVRLKPIQIEALQGSVAASGDVDLRNPEMPGRLSWKIADVDLTEAAAAPSASDELPPLAGRLTGSGQAEGSLIDLPASLSGEGDLHVTEGQLVNLPVFRAVAQAMNVLNVFKGKKQLSETLDVNYLIRGDGIDVKDFELVGEVIAASGQGMIRYDGALDLRVRGGPMKRLTGALGRLGGAIGGVTQRLVAYRITGSFGRPKVNVQPLGIGKRVDRSEQATAETGQNEPE